MPDVYISNETRKMDRLPKEKKAKKKPKNIEDDHKFYSEEWKKETSQHPLSSFLYSPKKVNFETQDKEEKVILLVRRHPITNVPWVVGAAIMLVAPVLLGVIPFISFLPGKLQIIIIVGWYMLTTAFVLENFLSWFFNVNIITDERIVDIDFHHILYKEVSDAKIDNIQDVTYNMGGFIRTMFNYGDVFVQTAAEVPAFDFLAVPQPDKVSKILQDLIIEEEREKLEGRVR